MLSKSGPLALPPKTMTFEEDCPTFAELIRERREELGLTREELFDETRDIDPLKVGVPVPVIRRVETQRTREPRVWYGLMLATVLGLPVDLVLAALDESRDSAEERKTIGDRIDGRRKALDRARKQRSAR
ncbi:MAG: helix-turn-helix transcriptional regulator [Myxococcales bacterium FL481]|nr:MAG: helix-turn-helix transcriptional regulator [Myxococcales bacterium FL481]